jgi:hypothetical protein
VFGQQQVPSRGGLAPRLEDLIAASSVKVFMPPV